MGASQIDFMLDISVDCLDKTESAMDVRAMYKGLSTFAGRYDTRFWQLRTVAPLIRHHFVYVFPAEEHPEYKRFDMASLEKETFHWVSRDPSRPWDGDTNPTVGRMIDLGRELGERPTSEEWAVDIARICPSALVGRHIYFDAGGELWRRFVEMGKLTGADAVCPRNVPSDELAVCVAREAERQGDPLPVRAWFIYLFWDLYWDKKDDTDLEQLRQNHLVRELRTITKRMGAQEIDTPYDIFELPTEDGSYVPPQGRWWFDLSLDVDAAACFN